MIDTTAYLNSTWSSSLGKATTASNQLDKNAFLELMTAQMANQDPLEPMDNTEFLSQLAQFSSLEQMQNVAESMELLALSQTASTNSQMVNLIGKRVVAEGATVTLDGSGPVDLRYDLEEAPEGSLSITIKDASGKVVRTAELKNVGAGENRYAFDGLGSDGKALAAGTYSYTITQTQGGTVSGLTTYSNLIIDAVNFNGSTTTLKSGTETINVANIVEVKEN